MSRCRALKVERKNAPAKYNLVYLTRKPKKVNLIATVRLETVSIQPDLVIRILGL